MSQAAYVTFDGKIFVQREQADHHEAALFREWLESRGNLLSMVQTLPDTPEDWDGCTASRRTMLVKLMREAWLNLQVAEATHA